HAEPADLPSFPTRRSSDLKVKVGDTLSEGGVVALIEAADADADAAGDARSGSAAPAPKAGGDAGGEERAQPEADAKTTPAAETRSEEHTSELQSRENLVCR